MTHEQPIEATLVIPCFDEAASLPSLIAEAARVFADAPWCEVVLVDNGSTDGSAEVLARELAAPGRERIRSVAVPAPNVGYGHGILAGLRAARGEWLAWTHADLQTPLADVLAGLRLLRGAAEPRRTLVKGRRTGRPLRDRLFTRGMEVASLLLLGLPLTEINAQPKCFHRDLLELATRPPVDLSLDLYFVWLAARSGWTIRELDVRFGDRRHGASKWAFSLASRRRHVARTLAFMRDLRSR